MAKLPEFGISADLLDLLRGVSCKSSPVHSQLPILCKPVACSLILQNHYALHNSKYFASAPKLALHITCVHHCLCLYIFPTQAKSLL